MQANLSTVRILIVDDQNLIRKAIQVHLDQESDLEVVGSAKNGEEAIAQIEDLSPDVAIIDLEMPDMDGLTAIKIIRKRFTDTKILVLSSYDSHDYVNQAIEAGAKGYLIKGTPSNELANVIRSVNQGYFQLGPGLMEKLVIDLSNSSQATSKSLEEKLVIALKRFKQDTNKQIGKLVQSETRDFEQRFELNIDAYMRTFNRRHNMLETYVKRVEFKLYLLILIQIVAIFVAIAYWIISS